MKTNRVKLPVLMLLLVTACEIPALNGGYNKRLGKYNSKVEAQNNAMREILERFNRLPDDKNYKILYTFNSAPGSRGEEAMWYNRGNQRLALEVDPQSGIACSWFKIDKTILEKAVAANDGITGLDSLAQTVGNLPVTCR
ncbi:hypothetical protein DYU11_30225 [Fibrisoma montanum]|uniref:Uncharacterized protein n=1 Tax=Fibrisoma montanum TaxID=2305895 RepID=A0A418LXE7_9BACT|nr:hypothetical protein [Fibrisoma montanum]RIV17986.1 hypothetical protein DYU11_30225 [Fibrisoma montanum]